MDLMEDPYKQYEIREGIVFLIELSDAIYTPLHQLKEQSQIGEILNCINDLLSEMVVTFPNNGVGIYLYNCEHTGSKYAKQCGLNKIFSLNDLNSSNMKQLINILQDDLECTNPLESRFPPSKDTSDNLHTVLKTILREFQRKPHYNRKKMFWFTNNDQPYVNDKLKDSLRTMISDYEDNYIHVTPLFLDTFLDPEQKHPKPFDASLYQAILLNTNYLRNAATEPPGDAFDRKHADILWLKTTVSSQIRESIFRLREVKRVQFSCDIILSDGPGIGGLLGCSVKGYTLYNHEQVRHFKKISTESGEIKIAHNDTKLVKKGTQEEVKTEQGANEKQNQVQNQNQAQNDNDNDNELKNASSKAHTIYKGVAVKEGHDLKRSGSGSNEKVLLLRPEVSDYIRLYSFDHVPKAYVVDEDDGPEAGNDPAEDEDIDGQLEFSPAPYLKLLCFRNLALFQPYFNMKPPLFVAADLNDGLTGTSADGGYTNSFDTFKALYQSCVRLKKYALLFGCTKKNSKPDLYALYPTNVNKSSSGKTPDGFLLVNVPWLSEIRSLPDHMLGGNDGKFIPVHEEVRPTELVTLYGKLIDHFKPWKNYEPSQHSNPTLQYFYNTIKHEALQLDIEDQDKSLQANDWSVRKLMELRETITSNSDMVEIMKFLARVLSEVEKVEKSGSLKRNAEEGEGQVKKQKRESLSEAAIITLWKNDTWNNVSVAQLREFMGRYDRIKKATRKADMVANIIEYLESRR